MLRMRGRCQSRQVYVEAVPPGQNPGERTPEATEDALAPKSDPSDEIGRAAFGLQVWCSTSVVWGVVGAEVQDAINRRLYDR